MKLKCCHLFRRKLIYLDEHFIFKENCVIFIVCQFYGLVYVSFSNNTSRHWMFTKVFFLGLLNQCFVFIYEPMKE